MQVVVVGCGRVGSGLARTLEAEGHSVAIIDKLRKAFRRLPPDFSGLTVEGQDSTGKRWARLGSSKRMPLLPSRLETTPISSAPELPTKPLEWSGWWRESTTPSEPRSISNSASPQWPRSSGQFSKSGAGCCPTNSPWNGAMPRDLFCWSIACCLSASPVAGLPTWKWMEKFAW